MLILRLHPSMFRVPDDVTATVMAIGVNSNFVLLKLAAFDSLLMVVQPIMPRSHIENLTYRILSS